MRPSDALLIFALVLACGAREQADADALRADIATLRRLIRNDPAREEIARVERVADARPVYAADLLARGALVSAERHVQRLEHASMRSDRGRGWARRLADAYRLRLRGLRTWHEYLRDAASDDNKLLESISLQRRAEVAILHVDEAMEAVVPTVGPGP